MGSNERAAIISGILTASFWAIVLGFNLAFPNMIVPFGWALALTLVGFVGLIATAVFGVRAFLWKSRYLYVSSVSERLPVRGPSSPFRCYWISQTDPSGLIWGWKEHVGEIDWDGGPVRPKCQRIEATNHSGDTLVNVGIVVGLQSFGKPSEPPPLRQHEMTVEFDQIVSGGTGTAFIVNDSPATVVGRPIRALGTQVGGKPHKLSLHTKPFNLISLFPAERFLPSVIEAEEPPLHSKLSSAETVSAAETTAEHLGQSQIQHRRTVIKDCRDIVQQYRDAGLPERFGEFLQKQRANLDIQPHFGVEYMMRRDRQADRPDTPTQRDWDSAEYLRELSRLEKEWGL